MDNKIKHLEMIQGVINRMAGNSFMLKGWAVTLVAGIFALASKEADKRYFLITYVPIVVFWFLDSYYLLQERLYRDLYNDVRKKEDSQIDFSLNASIYTNLDFKRTLQGCLFSKTELWFYIPFAVVCASVIIITNI